MTEQTNPQPFKAQSRERVVKYASLYCLHMADFYIQSCATGQSDNLKKFLEWLDKKFYESKYAIDGRKNFDVSFSEKDVYKMEGKLADIRKAEMVVGLQGIAKYIYSMVRLFWDRTDNSNSLVKFTTKFLPMITKRVAEGKKY